MRRIGLTVIAILSFVVCAHVAASPTRDRKFDEFGDVPCEDEWARLDGFAVALENDRRAKGYIIFYGGRRHRNPYRRNSRPLLPRRGEADARAGRLKPYLVSHRGIASERVVLINGGYREDWTAELWIVPDGAAPPAAVPTVAPEEIKFRKGRARPRDYTCGDVG